MRFPLSLYSLLCAVGCGALGCAVLGGGVAQPPTAETTAKVGSPAAAPEGAEATTDGAEPATYEPTHANAAQLGAADDESADEESDDGELEEDEVHEHEGEKGHEEHGDEEGAYAETDSSAFEGRTKTQPSTPVAPRAAKLGSLDGLSRGELGRLLKKEPETLGPLSVGLPNSGRLFNAVELPESKYFHRVSPDHAFGTEETVSYLVAAAARVHAEFPDSPPLFVGHLSRKSGGHLVPHLSHQSGRDVDLGFYYSDKPRWYTRATERNLDVARTWALVRAVIVETDVEMILVDRTIIALLKSYALSHGEDPVWVERVFSGKEGGRMIIRHARGHATHLHIRFFNPEAQRRGQKLYPLLVEQNLVPPVVVYSTFRAKKGDTLGKIAKRYNTTVEALKRANGLRKSLIVAGRVYKIAQKGGPKPAPQQSLTFPERQLPPPAAPKKASPKAKSAALRPQSSPTAARAR